ncbi:hypothetical protein [Nannocystis pusilla]|uniref:hypothetical protein n=1 Tax=Nannocystis pusilla TaxID=889268 RepID=UPI003BF5F553
MSPTKPTRTLADATPPREVSAPELSSRTSPPSEVDPLRQLFRRHANHFSGVRARQIQHRLRDRLFREIPGEPETT